MILKDFPPSHRLRTVVHCFRVVALDFAKLPSIPSKLHAPRPEHCLHFCLDGHITIRYGNQSTEIYREPVLVGQHTQTFERSTLSRLLNFQIAFKPAALHQLLGLNAAAIADRHVPAHHVFGPEVVELHERLMAHETYDAWICLAEDFVTQLLYRSKNPGERFNQLINLPFHQFKTVDQLAALSCFSEKQFQRKFTERTGINPKVFLRISRFSQAYYLKSRFPEKDWLQIALTAGYHDYPHLVRDYKIFTGETPSGFHAKDSHAPEFVLGLDKDLYQSRIAIDI